MKALTLKEYNHFALEEAPEPTLRSDSVMVAVKACGICGSDVHGMDGIKIDAFPHTFHSMTFGGITLNDTQMIVADIDQGKGSEQTGSRIRGNHDQPDVIIGMSLLRKLHLFIAQF